jgi:hypothetical protein
MRHRRISAQTGLAGAASLLFTSCVTLNQAPPALPTLGFLNGTEFIVLQPYRYRIGSTAHSIEVPEGFVTDFASIPPGLRAIFERQGRYSRAAVIHDYLYWSQVCTREQADNIFKIAMRELGVRRRERDPIHVAVRAAGGAAWSANRRDRAANRPRVVPENRFGLADRHTWQSAREKLIAAGVRDPAFPNNPAACALGNSTAVP